MGRFIGIKPEPKAVPVSEGTGSVSSAGAEMPVTKDTPKKVTKRPARKKAEK